MVDKLEPLCSPRGGLPIVWLQDAFRSCGSLESIVGSSSQQLCDASFQHCSGNTRPCGVGACPRGSGPELRLCQRPLPSKDGVRLQGVGDRHGHHRCASHCRRQGRKSSRCHERRCREAVGSQGQWRYRLCGIQRGHLRGPGGMFCPPCISPPKADQHADSRPTTESTSAPMARLSSPATSRV